MKKLLALTIFASLVFIVNAQDNDTTEVLFEDNPIFQVEEPDARWTSEWGVILAKKTRVEALFIDKSNVKVDHSTRTRILIQDRAAVEYFSDFRLPTFTTFSMTITKPSGQVIEIDTSDAISVKEGISLSTGLGELSISRVEYKKLAIRFLEIGDIVDFTYRQWYTYDKNGLNDIWPARITDISAIVKGGIHTFGSNFPTMAEEFEIELDPKLYLNLRSLNGVPSYSTSVSDTGNNVYTVQMTGIDGFEENYFVDLDKSAPRIDYEISFNKNYRYYRSSMPLGQQGELTSQSTYDDVKRTVFMNCQPYRFGRKSVIKVWMSLREDDPEQYMRKTYRKLQWEFSKYQSNDYAFPSLAYANIMYAGLKRQGFDAEIVVCVPSENGDIEDILFRSDLVYGVRVQKDDGDYLYSFSFKKCSSFDDWDYRVVGSSAYAFKPTRNYEKFELTEIELPDYKPKSNRSDVELAVRLDLNKQRTSIKSTSRHHGELKTYYAEMLLTPFEMAQDIEWNFVGISKKYSDLFLKRLEEIEKAKREDLLETWASNDFEVASYKSFELKKSGMEMDNDMLEYEESFIASDLIKKAGSDDYVFDIGRLIGEQIAIGDHLMERRSDVDIDFVKRYQYIINLKIPRGYELENITALRYNVVNDAGLFTVEINIGANDLELIVTKAYFEKHLSAEKWPQLVEVLDAAYHFSQKSIVLTPEDDL